LAILPLLFFAVPQPERQETSTGEARPSLWADLREGFRYVLTWPGLMIVLVMATLINFLLTPTFSLLPLLVTKHFQGDALQLGWLEAAGGAGVIVGGLLLSVWGGFKRRMATALVGLIVMGAAIVMLGAVPAWGIGLAVIAMATFSIMNPIVNGSMGGILQGAIAPEMQGRVFALVFTLASAMSPIGLIIAGPVADWVGIQTWFWVGGAACALMGLVGFFIPSVLYLEDHERAKSAAIGELA
jgi:DHA3 family macrolide efflux protein-like MFS transporter